jgi:hypothetical protein
MISRMLACIAVVAAVALMSPSALFAQPACPAPTIVSADDVPCTVTISFVNVDTDPPTVISSVDVEPGGEVRTQDPRGATGIAVETPRGPVVIPHGGTLTKVLIAEGCCVDIEFDLWTCTIKITKSAGRCP